MATVAQWVVILSGVWLIAVSGLMLARPCIALRCLGNMASTNFLKVADLLWRLRAGISFVRFCELSRVPADM